MTVGNFSTLAVGLGRRHIATRHDIEHKPPLFWGFPYFLLLLLDHRSPSLSSTYRFWELVFLNRYGYLGLFTHLKFRHSSLLLDRHLSLRSFVSYAITAFRHATCLAVCRYVCYAMSPTACFIVCKTSFSPSAM